MRITLTVETDGGVYPVISHDSSDFGNPASEICTREQISGAGFLEADSGIASFVVGAVRAALPTPTNRLSQN